MIARGGSSVLAMPLYHRDNGMRGLRTVEGQAF